jgi:hypothetical protein
MFKKALEPRLRPRAAFDVFPQLSGTSFDKLRMSAAGDFG